MNTIEGLEKIVNDYSTLYPIGFTNVELNEFLDKYLIDTDSFFEKLGVNTVSVINNQQVIYRHDIIKALRCVIENREETLDEWD